MPYKTGSTGALPTLSDWSPDKGKADRLNETASMPSSPGSLPIGQKNLRISMTKGQSMIASRSELLGPDLKRNLRPIPVTFLPVTLAY